MKDFFSSVTIQKKEIDFNHEINFLKYKNNKTINKKIGAVATFIGTVRDMNEGDKVSSMLVEHYPEMTESSIHKILDNAHAKWSIFSARVVHRVGFLTPGEDIVFVGVSSGHRKASFESCEYIMDYLKTQAPFWKKEVTENGERWVQSRVKDETKAKEWGKNHS